MLHRMYVATRHKEALTGQKMSRCCPFCGPGALFLGPRLGPKFDGSRSFKVIDVGTPGKLVSSACYDKQQVCVYLQLF